jgi:hypothetical protein
MIGFTVLLRYSTACSLVTAAAPAGMMAAGMAVVAAMTAGVTAMSRSAMASMSATRIKPEETRFAEVTSAAAVTEERITVGETFEDVMVRVMAAGLVALALMAMAALSARAVAAFVSVAFRCHTRNPPFWYRILYSMFEREDRFWLMVELSRNS